MLTNDAGDKFEEVLGVEKKIVIGNYYKRSKIKKGRIYESNK